MSKQLQPAITPAVWYWRDAATVNGLGINSFKDALDKGLVKSRLVRGRRMVTTQALLAYVESFPDGKGANANLKRNAKNEDQPSDLETK